MINPVALCRALIRILLLVVTTLLLLSMQAIWLMITAFDRTARQSPVVMLWHRVILWILNIDVTMVNRRLLDNKKQKIFLGNHISYLDIMVLGARLNCFFVAKMDIAHWPIMGFLAKIGGTIFVVRERRHVMAQLDMLKQELAAGRSLLIFPEGTTGNGRDILPFKSSLLKAAYTEQGIVPLQPVGIIYTHLNGRRLLAADQFDRIAWYGDMTLGPHLWHILKQKGLSAKIILHQPITADQNLDAKQAALQAHNIIAHDFINQ